MVMIVVSVRTMVRVSVRIELTNYVTSRLQSLDARHLMAILRKSWSHLDNFMPCFGLKQLCLILMLALNFMMKCYRPHDRICLLIYCLH